MKTRMITTFVAAGLCLCASMAAAAPASTGNQTLPMLKVSDNGRFLVSADGKPFFWLGDTSWAMLSKCVREDAKDQPSILRYFQNRQAKRFNVLQVVLVNTPTVSNAYGHKPFINGDFTRPLIVDGPNNDYWDLADWFIDQAAAHGMYLSLLPIWADSFNNAQPVAKDPNVAYRYGHFLGDRYRSRSNIIWVLGGDASPDRDVINPLRLAGTRAMTEGIADGVNGVDAFDGQADYSTTLMTYHPRGGGQSSSKILHNEPWLDFNMIQTTTKFAFSNYDTVQADYEKTPAKPTLDAEVAYEGSLSLNGKEPQDRRVSPWHVRLAAYWNVFAGGFGHTYGHRSFIMFVRDGEKLRWGAEIPWYKSLDAPGSFQMTHLRSLMEARPCLSRIPDQSLLAGEAGNGFDHVQATRDRDGACAMVYIPTGKPVTIHLDKISGGKVRAWWFDPRQGKPLRIGEFEAAGARRFDPPRSGEDNDWILVLDDATKQFAAPERQATGLPKPADLPPQPALPDPLVMLDGRKVTTPEIWTKERRPELIRLFQHYMYGQLPPKPMLSAKVERVDAAAFGGKATLSEVTLTFGPAATPEAPPIHLMLIVPNRRNVSAPVVLALNYFGNHTLVRDRNVRLPDNWMPQWGGEGAWSAKVVANRATEAGRGSWTKFWPIEDLIDRGYALATFYNGDIDPDTPDQRGLQKFFQHADPADDCGTIGAWAWGLQRAVDYLVTAPGIDPRRIITTGHSRTGKAALIAAAFDERIALTIPHQAGCGGTAPSRARLAIGKPYNTLDTPQTKPPETVFNINDKFPHWFNARFKQFDAQPERLPFDQHCLVALCAPRPVLFTNGRADTWINPAGQFEVLRAAAPVYRLLGAGDFTAEQLPPDGKLIDGVLGYYLRPGAHSLLREDWKLFLDFADKRLGAPSSEKPPAGLEEKAVLPGDGDRGATGPIVIDPDHPHSFRHQNGRRFFPMGDTAYYLIAQPKNVIAHYIDLRRAHKFNFIRMMAMADGFWPFGGTPAKPQYTVIDETTMRKWDWVFDYAAARGMNIELIIFGYGVAGGEGLWAGQANQDFWIRTLVNRFKGRPNLFMYTIANEFERYPDGKYQYAPADVQWARGVAARIRELDLIHPVGCHPSVWITDQDPPNKGPRPFAAYKGFTQHPPQVVWPLWEGSAVNLNVTQNNEGVQPRTWGNIDGSRRGLTYYPTNYQGLDYPAKWTATGWDFEAAGLEDCLAEDWAHGKPVLNTEFGYQHEPGYESEMNHATHQCHQPATVRRKAWKIATAGAYLAAGFEGTAVRNFTDRDADNFRPAQLEVLYDFFTEKTEYWKMSPHLDLVASHNVLLASPGKEYVAYFPRGGTSSIKLVAGAYAAQWLHPETGRYYRQPDLIVTDGGREFVPPERPNDDWVLHLRQRK